jgi:hypothetical protein
VLERESYRVSRPLWSALDILILSFLGVSAVQTEPIRSKAEVRAVVGYSSFPDDGPHHFVSGGSVRLYFTQRLAFEPEFLSMYHSREDLDLHLVPNLVFDFTRRESRLKPYLIGGVGIQWHRGLTGAGYYWSRSATANIGVGSKIFLTERLYVAPEVRLGWEPILRIAGSVGYVFPARSEIAVLVEKGFSPKQTTPHTQSTSERR